jgi:aconitase A
MSDGKHTKNVLLQEIAFGEGGSRQWARVGASWLGLGTRTACH